MESYPLRNSCSQWTHTNLLLSGASLCVLVSQYILLVEKTPPIRTLQTNELIIIHYLINSFMLQNLLPILRLFGMNFP